MNAVHGRLQRLLGRNAPCLLQGKHSWSGKWVKDWQEPAKCPLTRLDQQVWG